MLRLIRYNLRNQFARVSTYLIPTLIFVIIMVIKAIMNVDSGLMSLFNGMGNDFFFMSRTFFVELTMFVGSLLFVGLVINNIYKGPKEDGSIMAIISKPIKRWENILGNLLSLGINIVIFGLALFTFYGISTTLDSGSSVDKVLSTVSILVGVIVIMFIFASIILLIGSFMSSKSLIIFSVIAGGFIPLISIVISLTAEPELKKANIYHYVDGEEFINDQDINGIYLDLSTTIGETKQLGELATGKADLYKSLSYVDPWYQLSGLFTLLVGDEHTHINWEQKSIDHKGSIKLMIKGKETYVSLLSRMPEQVNVDGNLYTMKYNMADSKYIDAIKALTPRINALTFEKQIMLANAMLQLGTQTDAAQEIADKLKDAEDSTDDNALKVFHDTDPMPLMFLRKLSAAGVLTISEQTHIIPGTFYTDNNWNSYIISNDQKISTFVKGDYINKTYLFIFWAAMSIIFFWITALVEFKRDIMSH